VKNIKFIVYKEGKYYVSQCLNVDVSSFGKTLDEAKENLKEALMLYFEDVPSNQNFLPISDTLIGENQLNIECPSFLHQREL